MVTIKKCGSGEWIWGSRIWRLGRTAVGAAGVGADLWYDADGRTEQSRAELRGHTGTGADCRGEEER